MPIAVRNWQKYIEGLMEFDVLKIEDLEWTKVYVLPPWRNWRLISHKFKLPPEFYIKKHYLFCVWMDGKYWLTSFQGLGALGQAVLQREKEDKQ